MVSDGAFRKSTSKAAASWAVLAMTTTSVNLVAAGALLLPEVASSLDAELTGFELGLAAFLKLSRGYVDVIPHGVDVAYNATELLTSIAHLMKVPV